MPASKRVAMAEKNQELLSGLLTDLHLADKPVTARNSFDVSEMSASNLSLGSRRNRLDARGSLAIAADSRTTTRSVPELCSAGHDHRAARTDEDAVALPMGLTSLGFSAGNARRHEIPTHSRTST